MDSSIVAVPDSSGEARIDSRSLAVSMDNAHASVVRLLKKHAAQFTEFGQFGFEISTVQNSAGAANDAQYARLNESQCYFLLTLVRNSAQTVPMKAALVHAFQAVRTAPALPAPTPALISAREFAESCGLTLNAASMRLLRSGILPTHHYADPRMHVPAYLYPLAEVQAYWPEYALSAYGGAAKPGLPRALKPMRGQREQTLFSPLTPLQQLGADLVEQLVAEFMRDELPVRFKAALRGPA